MNNLGFLLLSNIPDFDEEKLFAHQKWFFSLPDEVKAKLHMNHYNSENPNHYRGLAPFIANDPSFKELYEIGLDYEKVSEDERKYHLHEETPWPDYEGSKEFTLFMKQQYNMMH
jgi:isopenicillin N synthase-like dioxygenase